MFQKNRFLFIFDCFMKHDSLLCHCDRLKLLLADILPILPYSRYISLIGLAAIICGRKGHFIINNIMCSVRLFTSFFLFTVITV